MSKSYAQLGQDLLAVYFFKRYTANQKFFLDIGAFDGINYSNKRILFEQGWRGVCIEPVAKNYKKLESLYEGTKVITVQAAAADYEGEMTLNVATIPWASDWGPDVSTPADDVMEHWPDYVWEKETASVMTVNRILELHHITGVDFVSIDVEGEEMAVLRGFDIEKHNPRLLVIEYSTLQERRDIIQHMNQRGYFLWIDTGQDMFFVRGPVLGHWKIFIRGLMMNLKAGRHWWRIMRSSAQ